MPSTITSWPTQSHSVISFPAETRAYVPKLLAVSRLVADPDGNGVTIMRIRNQPYFSVVKTHGQLDLALAADLAGVSVEEIYALNPGYNRWATDPAGPNRLLVPVDAAAAFESNLAALPAREQVQWERYRIRNGDSLSVIARKFHTTQKLIREVNNLRGSTIRAGKYLMIPRASKSAGKKARRAVNILPPLARYARCGAEASVSVDHVRVNQVCCLAHPVPLQSPSACRLPLVHA